MKSGRGGRLVYILVLVRSPTRDLSLSRESFFQLLNGHDGPVVPAVADDLVPVGKGNLKHHPPIRRTHKRNPERDRGLNRRGADVEELDRRPNAILAGI